MEILSTLQRNGQILSKTKLLMLYQKRIGKIIFSVAIGAKIQRNNFWCAGNVRQQNTVKKNVKLQIGEIINWFVNQ